jgi:DNA (cytosine-5)-methyltransferase 1
VSTVDFIIDDFAGPGGWEARLDGILGDTPLIGVEWDQAAVDTARAAGLTRVQGDVRQSTIPLIGALCAQHGRAFGYIASPPCQTFSAAGKGAGRQHLDALLRAVDLVASGYDPDTAVRMTADTELDERSVLALHPLHVILKTRPDWVLLEQVAPVLPLWEGYADVLREHGYAVRTEVVQAEQYGVPQTRKRAILVATRSGGDAPWPTPTHSRYYPRDKARLDAGVQPWVSMAQALGWGMTERPYFTVAVGTEAGGADTSCVGGTGARRSLHAERDSGRWASAQPCTCDMVGAVAGQPSTAHRSTCEQHVGPVTAVEGDTSWVHTRPSPSMVSSFAPDVVAAPGYRKAGDPPRQKTPGSVRITVEQAGVLQSFPANWPWQGSRTKQYQQVGNAVPPLLGRAFIEAVLSA